MFSNKPFKERFIKDMKRNWMLYAIAIPMIVFYFLFAYKPMYGALIAFKEYKPARGFIDSPWVSNLEKLLFVFLQ